MISEQPRRHGSAPSLRGLCSLSNSTLKWPCREHREGGTLSSLTTYRVAAFKFRFLKHIRESRMVTTFDASRNVSPWLLVLLSARYSTDRSWEILLPVTFHNKVAVSGTHRRMGASLADHIKSGCFRERFSPCSNLVFYSLPRYGSTRPWLTQQRG